MPYVFVPPTVFDRPAILPDSYGMASALFKFYAPGERGVNVFKLQDGTFVQDTPTPENANSNVPYPIPTINAEDAMILPDVVTRGWDPLALQDVVVTIANPVVKIYFGGHQNVVTADEAAALIAAGYTVTGP